MEDKVPKPVQETKKPMEPTDWVGTDANALGTQAEKDFKKHLQDNKSEGEKKPTSH